MKSTKSELGTRKETPIYTKRFRYSGNISHIKAYIEKNKIGEDCIVEIYVRPLTRQERDEYGLPARKPKMQKPRPIASSKKNGRSSDSLEKRSQKISGADLDRWRTSVQSGQKEVA